MTWEIVLGIAELAAFVGVFAKWSSTRAKTDAETAGALRELAGALKDFKSQSAKEHDELWHAHDDHETRIRDIEIKHGGNGT